MCKNPILFAAELFVSKLLNMGGDVVYKIIFIHEEFILITNLLYDEVKHDINNIFPLKFKKK